MRRALPLLIGAAFALPACGGDDDGDSPERAATGEATSRTKAEPSAAAYRRALNKLCREDERAADEFGEPATPDQLTSYLRRTLAYSRKKEPLYRALEPPPEFRAEHRRYLELSDEGEAVLVRTLRAVDAGSDPVTEFTKALPKLAEVIEEINKLARHLKAKDCVVEVPAPGAQSPRDPA